ncbi:MAG: hypothetical protein ACYCZN_01430 [Candidatus Dormibacteria bacterium]
MAEARDVVLVIQEASGVRALTSRGDAEVVTLDVDDPLGSQHGHDVLDGWRDALTILTDLGQGPGSKLYEAAAGAIAEQMDRAMITWERLGVGPRPASAERHEDREDADTTPYRLMEWDEEGRRTR